MTERPYEFHCQYRFQVGGMTFAITQDSDDAPDEMGCEVIALNSVAMGVLRQVHRGKWEWKEDVTTFTPEERRIVHNYIQQHGLPKLGEFT